MSKYLNIQKCVEIYTKNIGIDPLHAKRIGTAYNLGKRYGTLYRHQLAWLGIIGVGIVSVAYELAERLKLHDEMVKTFVDIFTINAKQY